MNGFDKLLPPVKHYRQTHNATNFVEYEQTKCGPIGGRGSVRK